MENLILPDDVISVSGYRLKVSKSGVVFLFTETGMKRLHAAWTDDLSLLNVVLPDKTKIAIVPHEEGMMVLDAGIVLNAKEQVI